MNQTRNTLYQIKKLSWKRISPFYQPNTQEEDIRNQLQNLRTQLRAKDTEILRLQAKLDEMKQKIVLMQFNSKKQTQYNSQKQKTQISNFSGIPMIFQNKQLKQQNQKLHQQNLYLNGKNNELQADLRQKCSDIKRLQMKVKQLDILQKMRQQRFKDQVSKLTPIIVEENKDIVNIKQGLIAVTDFLKQCLVDIVFQIFLKCAKQCEGEKKTSSYNIFKMYFTKIKQSKNYGLMATLKSYISLKKMVHLIQQNYAQILQNQQYRDTMNQWIICTLIDIKNTNSIRQKQQKLFRYLGLMYRSQFPIKGQHYTIDVDIKSHFYDLICQQMLAILSDK